MDEFLQKLTVYAEGYLAECDLVSTEVSDFLRPAMFQVVKERRAALHDFLRYVEQNGNRTRPA